MEYFSVQDMNEAARNPQEFVRWSEERYAAKIEQAAAQILQAGEHHRPLALLSGPSGSGKTTTAQRIQTYLTQHGHKSYTLSMDNYYFRRPDGVLPMDEEGQPDLESPEIIDMALLSSHLQKLANCEPFEMPVFDFANQRRSEQTIPMHRKPGEIVIMEGIHALNPRVVGERSAEFSTGIYVSVRTRITEDDGFVLHPSKVRLMRRLLRDFRHRGQDYTDTVSRLRSVSRGERLYIMPNKNNAAIHIDTFIPYELAVYRNELLLNLNQVNAAFLEDMDVSDMVPMLRQIDPISAKLVPDNGLIQEFIGEDA